MNTYDPLATGSEAVLPDATFPWPPAEDESLITAFSRTWQDASLRPRSFFARMPEQGGLGAAVLYYLVIGIAAAGAMLFFRMIIGPPDGERSASLLSQLGFGGGWNPLLDFLFSPLTLLLSLFVAAGVAHVLLLMLGGATRPYTFTVRTFAFAYSPQLLGLIPYVGSVVGFVWMVVIAIIGLSAGHRTSTGRAAVAVLLPVLIALVFLAIAFFFAAALFVGEGLG